MGPHNNDNNNGGGGSLKELRLMGLIIGLLMRRFSPKKSQKMAPPHVNMGPIARAAAFSRDSAAAAIFFEIIRARGPKIMGLAAVAAHEPIISRAGSLPHLGLGPAAHKSSISRGMGPQLNKPPPRDKERERDGYSFRYKIPGKGFN
jgi:hypothetical protein